MTGAASKPTPHWHLFVPKLITVLRQGYGPAALRNDVVAGLTVAIVALPLAMALAIASGTTPDKGLYTAIIAGFLISALGGSRFQIGGPTGAFVVVVFNVIAQHGFDGLVVATLMAGAMLVAAGLLRLGTWIKYIPQPVVTGFTAGIAVIIFSSQVKDLFGLDIGTVPAEFLAKWLAFWEHRDSLDPLTLAVAAGSLAVILGLRRFAPRLPGFLVAVGGGALAVWTLGLPVDTIGSRFGGIPSSLPVPAWPSVPWSRIPELVPSAFTIAFLAGVESLLSAVVADGLTGRRHRSNCELVAQGIANIASGLFGGLPATGAIARTATNIRSGARSPLAGMLHAVFLLAFMLALAPLASFVPLASLAAVLVVVAWNMSEVERFRHLMSAPLADRAALLLTFGLTVLVDLTVAIEVGVVVAALAFMHRMAQAVEIQSQVRLIDEDADDFDRPAGDVYDPRTDLPDGVVLFRITGPFFFGVATRLSEVLDQIGPPPKIFILDLRAVPLIDATGVGALSDLVEHCRRTETAVILAGMPKEPRRVLDAMGLGNAPGVAFAQTLDAAVAIARRDLAQPPEIASLHAR
ncbi:SulP family inorganic anion transporter [Azospirillum agricola]|uniref:SulP family inorganic anion transporter n=1 Tax=Azospirillum agricola TaxID=1720247 RepID=UPI000A0F34E2|nr:sulfate permease [Azospirillum agricola]SMH46320.1 sulfate permease, SulP family [Azospirillum lipoferum]